MERECAGLPAGLDAGLLPRAGPVWSVSLSFFCSISFPYFCFLFGLFDLFENNLFGFKFCKL
jgi:hypothetical protein